MKSSFERLFAVGATVAALGSATPAFAQTPVSGEGVIPQQFPGNVTCTTPDIEAFCNFLDDPDDPDDGPIQLLVTNPPNNATNTFSTGVVSRPAFSGTFQVRVITAGGRFNFTDQSLDGSSTESQQADTPGVECVIVKSGGNANVYRRVNLASDTGLGPPSGNISQIRFCWSEGPCKETQTPAVVNSCGEWNAADDTPGAHFLQGHLATPDQPLNLCGCPPVVARLCDPRIPAGEGGCFATGADLTSIDTQAATTAGESASAPAALGISILATTPTCTTSQCLTTKTYRIGGTTVSSQVCVANNTSTSTCP